MLIKFATTFILTFFLLILTGCGENKNDYKGINYYVSTAIGSDIYNGTEAKPFKTIQKAADVARAGDTVIIKAGTYNEQVWLDKYSGNAKQKITFKNHAHDIVIIDGNGISWGNWGGLFHIEKIHHINILGIHLKNSSYAGFFIEKSHHIKIKNTSTDNTYSSGIGVWESDSIIVDHNEVNLACNDGGDESITLANTSNSTVSNNNVHNNGAGTIGGEGIDVKDGSHDVDVFGNEVHHLNGRIGIYVDAWNKHTYNINIYANRVHHNQDSGMAAATEMGGVLENINFYNNVVYNNKYGGIEIGAWVNDATITNTPINKVKIINNTLYKNAEGINIKNDDAKKIIIKNNIAYQNTNAPIVVELTPSNQVTQENNLTTDPLFKNAIAANFSLTANSPAIDVGSATNAPRTDIENKPRPRNNKWDIGAYEF